MKALIFVLAVISLAAQRPAPGKPEQYPGQSSHAKPPDGWMCSPKNTQPAPPPDHACLCHMECEKAANGEEMWKPDPQCSAFCFEKSCSCPHMHCSESEF